MGEAETDGLFLDPSGRLIFSQRPKSSAMSTSIVALDPKTLAMTPVLDSPGCGWATNVVGNGVDLAARCGSIVTVWNAQTGQQIFLSATSFTGGLAYFKGRLLAANTPVQGSGSIGVVDVPQKTTKTWLSGLDSPGAIAVFGDLVIVGENAGEGRLLAVGGDGEAGATQAVWAAGTRAHTIVSHGSDLFWSDSGGASRPPGDPLVGEGKIFWRRGDGTVEVLASSLTYPTGIWVDDDALYWVSWGATKPFASLFRARRLLGAPSKIMEAGQCRTSCRWSARVWQDHLFSDTCQHCVPV